MSNQRLTYIDLGAGVMMIWLLFFHASYPMHGKDVLGAFPFFFFFMPWFFYKSGYFYCQTTMRNEIQKGNAKLLKQFAIWSAIGYVCYLINHAFILDNISLRIALYSPMRSLLLNGSIPLNTALWFLLTLYFVRIIVTWSFSKLQPLAVGIISVIIACCIHFVGVQYIPEIISSITWGLFFFCVGNYIKQYEQNKWVVVFSIIALVATYVLTDIPEVYTRKYEIKWFWYIMWYPASIVGCVVFNNICLWIEAAGKYILKNIVSWSPFPLLRWIGRHSMMFYVAHYIIFRMTYDIVAQINVSWYRGWQGLLICAIAYFVIIVPLCIITDRIKVKYAK